MLWIAQLVSNLGNWMQSVGAQWFLVEQAHSAALVAWVQSAGLLPVLLFSLFAGVMADSLDRRRLLIWLNISATVIAGVLTLLAAAGSLTPLALLGMTFLLGCTGALASPAWQAVQPELVPRVEIPAAASLGSVTVNIARVIGPAAAGVVVAAAGPAPVFGLNALSFAIVIVLLAGWRRSPQVRSLPREPFGEAVTAGIRYIRAAPGVRRLLLRAGLFTVPGSALWALLPTVAGGRLQLGASGYGVLLGALGLGSVIGVFVAPWMRRRMSSSRVLTLSALLFAVGSAAVAAAPLPVLVVLLVPTGLAWIASLTTLNATLQLAVADWVRARVLGAYFVVFMGGQGVGAFIWGALAVPFGTGSILLISALLLLASALSVRWLPLRVGSEALDRSVVAAAEDGPALVFQPSDDHPIAVVTDYQVPEGETEAFLAAMSRLELTRRRAGAYLWRIERSGVRAGIYREEYTVRSYAEYRRALEERRTGYDADVVQSASCWRPQVEDWFPVAVARKVLPPMPTSTRGRSTRTD